MNNTNYFATDSLAAIEICARRVLEGEISHPFSEQFVIGLIRPAELSGLQGTREQIDALNNIAVLTYKSNSISSSQLPMDTVLAIHTIAAEALSQN